VNAGSGATAPDQDNGPSSEGHEFITRAVGKAVEAVAARLDAISEQPAEIRQAQARGREQE
jgi:hypothetical protein